MAKECSNCSHGSECYDGWRMKFKKRYFFIGLGIAAFIVLISTIILIVYLALRPRNPSFTLRDASVMDLNLSTAPYSVATTLQVSIFFRNPNNRIGVHYDELKVYASYKDRQITLPTAFPPLYQSSKEVSAYSPFLCGVGVPIAPFLAVELDRERGSGVIHLDVRADGKVRWKVGSWRSGQSRIHVNCPAVFIDYYNGRGEGNNDGSMLSPAFRIHRMSKCHVDDV